jgi:hypothetical protein
MLGHYCRRGLIKSARGIFSHAKGGPVTLPVRLPAHLLDPWWKR